MSWQSFAPRMCPLAIRIHIDMMTPTKQPETKAMAKHLWKAFSNVVRSDQGAAFLSFRHILLVFFSNCHCYSAFGSTVSKFGTAVNPKGGDEMIRSVLMGQLIILERVEVKSLINLSCTTLALSDQKKSFKIDQKECYDGMNWLLKW